MDKLSVVIPVYNESDNILPLVERLDNALRQTHHPYELIFIDDRSTDNTYHAISQLTSTYPIRVFTKQGLQGKAQSLLEGFSKSEGELVAMIDGDLQYPPEALPTMIKKINRGADIVVARRVRKQTSPIRQLVSNVHRLIFDRLMHNLDYDVQSGFKVFKKEIIERMSLHPSPWSFDLEFLLKARDAGYKIVNENITFAERYSGKAKINLLSASLQIGISAIKLKLFRPDIIPFHPRVARHLGNGFHYRGGTFIHHSNLKIEETAFFRLSRNQTIVLFSLMLIILVNLFLQTYITIVFILGILSILYLTDMMFNFFLIARSFTATPEIKVSHQELNNLAEDKLPKYTIFCPLYKEWQVLPQFISAVSKLDYPKDKLEVLLLLEENDTETITRAKQFDLPSYFKIITVPDSSPKTKPKACNFGLHYATGQYLVIYDAEDIPDVLQLKKAVIAFAKSPKEIVCIQAKLNYYNPHQNLLTRVFTAEYSLWFDLILTGLQSIKAPIPLGGTSNHFKTEVLLNLKGWDAFNVTEDCDLGIRLFKKGYTTAIMDSTTLEEANSSLPNWFGQRSRWIKGYIQSYLVHMRNPGELMTDWRHPHILSFQLIVGGKILSILVNPLLWIVTISYFLFRPTLGPTIEKYFPAIIFYPAVFSAVIGNFLYLYYYMIGCVKRKHYDIVKYVYLVPIYWLFMSMAAWYALYKIIQEPHYWYKTKHGLHLNVSTPAVSGSFN